MTKEELDAALLSLITFIDGQIDAVVGVSEKIQQKVFKSIRERILKFEISEGKFVPTQDFSKKLLDIEQDINELLTGKEYSNSIMDFLTSFDEIEERTVYLHRTFNELEIKKDELTPARKFIYEQAKYSLTEGMEAEYIRPMQHLLMQQITSNASITDSIEMLEKWNEGELRPVTGEPIHSLPQYTTQIARDTAYSVNRTINAVIKDEYDLQGFIYAGDIIKDSRPLCVHLVELDREISFTELRPMLQKYPQGLYPDTTIDNFCNVAGGYSCRHTAFPVRVSQKA